MSSIYMHWCECYAELQCWWEALCLHRLVMNLYLYICPLILVAIESCVFVTVYNRSVSFALPRQLFLVILSSLVVCMCKAYNLLHFLPISLCAQVPPRLGTRWRYKEVFIPSESLPDITPQSLMTWHAVFKLWCWVVYVYEGWVQYTPETRESTWILHMSAITRESHFPISFEDKTTRFDTSC